AADVERAALPSGHRGDDLVALALPVALQGNAAVERALVVVGGLDRVAQDPQAAKGGQQVEPETNHAPVRAAAAARLVGERETEPAPAGGVRLDEDLLEDLEIAPAQRQLGDGGTAVESKPARQVADRQAEATAEEPVQHAAEQRAGGGLEGHPAARVP